MSTTGSTSPKRTHTPRWLNANKTTTPTIEKVKDEDVMIQTSIKDLEAMMEGVEEHTSSRFERFFLPSLLVFAAIIFGFFIVIYSITTDMTRLADTMGPKMGEHMQHIATSIGDIDQTINTMTTEVSKMNKNFALVNENMSRIVKRLENMSSIDGNMSSIAAQMNALTPMVESMQSVDESIKHMDNTMMRLDQNIFILRQSFQGPMNAINSIPFL